VQEVKMLTAGRISQFASKMPS